MLGRVFRFGGWQSASGARVRPTSLTPRGEKKRFEEQPCFPSQPAPGSVDGLSDSPARLARDVGLGATGAKAADPRAAAAAGTCRSVSTPRRCWDAN